MLANNGHIYQNDHKNFAPRLGLAYRLTAKTVIRTGGGIFYDNWATWVQLGQSYGANWPSVNLLQATNLNPNVVTVRAANPLAGIGAGALPAPTPFTLLQTYKDPFMKTPYTEEWNFGIQQQVGENIGALGRLCRLAWQPAGSEHVLQHRGHSRTRSRCAPRRPYSYITPTNYERTNGRSSYEALEVSFNRRMSSGLSSDRRLHLGQVDRYFLLGLGGCGRMRQSGSLQYERGQERFRLRPHSYLHRQRRVRTAVR